MGKFNRIVRCVDKIFVTNLVHSKKNDTQRQFCVLFTLKNELAVKTLSFPFIQKGHVQEN